MAKKEKIKGSHFFEENFAKNKKNATFVPEIVKMAWVLSSVGSEHLVYTQRVGGSNPSGPTEKEILKKVSFFDTRGRLLCLIFETFEE